MSEMRPQRPLSPHDVVMLAASLVRIASRLPQILRRPWLSSPQSKVGVTEVSSFDRGSEVCPFLPG